MEQNNNKPMFVSEKNGDTEKYKTIVGVREHNPETDKLRQQMKEKMMNQIEKKQEDLAASLSNPENKAVRYGIVGSGHGGSRLAEQFYQFGYKVCAINTSKQDLHHINLPENQKLFMDYALGGAGKDMDIGSAAVQESEQEIKQLIETTFGEQCKEIDSLVVCVGGGGGSGTGSILPIVTILSDYQVPITILYTLPMTSEGTVTKANAIEGLDKLAKLSVNKIINGLIIIDNSRIEEIYTNVSLGGFFKVANFDIANIFNTFNTLSSLPTQYSAIDPMDFAKIMTSGNCTIYGKVEIPLVIENGMIQVTEDDVANALLQNLNEGLLADSFDVSEALRAGVYITGKAEYLEQIPASTFNYAFASLNEELKKADLFKGVYADERLNDKLTIYALISGVGLPRERVELLKEQAAADVQEMEEKEQSTRSKMEVFQQQASREQDKYRLQKKKGTTFGKMVDRRRGRN
jgi:cell division protein FtsZ